MWIRYRITDLLLSIALLAASGCQQAAVPLPGEAPATTSDRAVDFEEKEIATTDPGGNAREEPPQEEFGTPAREDIRFARVAEKLMVSHTFQTGATGRLIMVESLGGGLGWLDLDGDGRLDLYCVQGGDPTSRDHLASPPDSVFRQTASGKMQLLPNSVGIDNSGYGQGLTIGDFDNDGFDDVYVTNVGRNRLFHNQGDGTFRSEDSTATTESEIWSSSAAWADVDLDGDLDLYVCNYLQYDPFDPFLCEKDGAPALCHPRQLEPLPDDFFENQGDGTFVSNAKQRGLVGNGNKALGVVVSDLSGDGWPDIYVANDTTSNFYFTNRQDGTFRESSLELGGGLNAAGAMQASMGIAAGDYDRSGSTDLLLTHFTGESNTLYQNLQEIGLFDQSGRTGLFAVSMSKLGFGAVMADFDCNGNMDLLVANGHIDSANADGDGFMQCAQALTFDGRRWADVSETASEYFSEKHVGRAIAMGDYDGDGDVDLAIAHQNESVEILENVSRLGSWLKVVPIAESGNRSRIGVSGIVEVGGQEWYSCICGGTSYCASHEHALFFGVGETDQDATVTIQWPGGKSTIVRDVKLNQILTIREP